MSTSLRSRPWLSDAPAEAVGWEEGVGTPDIDQTVAAFVGDLRAGGFERIPMRHFSASGLRLWGGTYGANRIKKAAPVLASVMTWYKAGQEEIEAPDFSADRCAPRWRAFTWVADDQDFYRLAASEDHLAPRFERLAEQWEDDTWAYSFIERNVLHPAYQRIIGMGPDAVPLIMRRLQDRGPDHWFWALEMITGENPAEGTETMEDATKAWLSWGHEIGYI